nr:HAMP domain-containing sensor histidine kinase [Thermoanaerobaculia bacterium]
NKLVPILGADLARRDDEQLARVLDRIREKIIAQLRPRDLAYQILDGLAQLVHYDHSAALFLFDPQAKVMRLDAEKVAWTKAKSGFIGLELAAPEALVASLAEPPAIKILTPSSAEDALAALFQPYERYSQGRGIPPVSATLYAPLWVGTELLGLLKIAAFARAPFDARDASIVERFLPAAEVALANVQANLRLEDRAVEAESRAGLVTLARAVAHDVNQAVGTILLLADQARADLADGRGDPVQLAMDLEEILEKASLCRRIFGNMLRVGTERLGAGPVDLNRLVEELVPLFSAQVGGRPIELSFALAESLPVVRASRPHLERILWNLVTNAIEALAGRSGRIEVATERDGEAAVRLAVADNGPGIEAEILNKVQEPFFTTKPNGHGLGLSICRSLAWQLGGSLHLDSTPGEGTRAEVRLPVVAAENAP